jgi:hypothetical protein
VHSVSITIEKRTPLELIVVFDQGGAKATLDELWHRHLATREVTLLYLSGFPVSSYTTNTSPVFTTLYTASGCRYRNSRIRRLKSRAA